MVQPARQITSPARNGCPEVRVRPQRCCRCACDYVHFPQLAANKSLYVRLMSFSTELDCFKNADLLDLDGNHISVHTMKALHFHPASVVNVARDAPCRRSLTTRKKRDLCKLLVAWLIVSAASLLEHCRVCPPSQTRCPTRCSLCTPAQAPTTLSHFSKFSWTTTRSPYSLLSSTSMSVPCLQLTTFCALTSLLACHSPYRRFVQIRWFHCGQRPGCRPDRP